MRWNALAAACGILLSNAPAAFIEAPIPPSDVGNFFADGDGDGMADFAQFSFIGKLSREYLDSGVVRLSFCWPDAGGKFKEHSFRGKELPFDTASPNTITVPIPREGVSAFATSVDPRRQKARILFNDSSVAEIAMGDKIPPQIKSAILFTSEALSGDSLGVAFSEPVTELFPDSAFLEYKHAGESFALLSGKSVWNENKTSVRLVHSGGGSFPSPGDSVRILPGRLADSSGNSPGETSPFREILDVFPFHLYTNSLTIVHSEDSLKAHPIFERLFVDTSAADIPKNSLGVAMPIGGKDFKSYVRRFVESSESPDPANLDISVSMQIYTRTGEYVTSVHSKTKCSDLRFGGDCFENPRKFYLKWNLMASDRRVVGTGTYLAKIQASVSYGDVILWQSGSGKDAVKIWGVKRSSRGAP